jgi:hypothetical protein
MMLRKRLLFFLVLIALLVLPVFASAAVLWDQPITTTNTTAWTSFFNPNTTWTIYDRYIADDFTNGETWQISKIFIPGSFRSDGQYPFPNASTTYSTLAGATSFKWEIYGNSGGVPAGTPQGAGTNPIWELSLANGDPQVSITNGVDNYPSNVTLTLSTPFNLTAGTYWLVFYPVIDGSIDGTSAGRYGRNISLTTNGFDGQFICTDVVSQTQPIVWTSVQDPYWWALTTQDFAFRLEGTAGTPAPDIAVAPATLAFDPTLVGVTATAKTVTITNNGGAQLNVTNMTITGANASEFAKATGGTCATTYPINLAAGGSCTQNVTFTPSSVGAKTATLAITSNDGDTPTANVSLTGTGIAPDIAVAPVALDFDPELVGSTSAAKEVAISNTGSAPLNINSIVISGTNAAMFAVATGGVAPCASLTPTIAAGANCTVNVTFTPTSAGAKTASLDISSNDGDTPTVNVPLTGAGIQGELSVTEGTIGTEIIINGSGFGESKGKVFIGDVAIKVAKDGWTANAINCTMSKVIPVGLYYVTIQPKPKGTPPIVLTGTFTVNKPEINLLTSDNHGAPETEATIRGLWFGTKKGKVYLGDYKGKVKSWTMSPTTGESTIVFVVPKKIGAGTYPLEVENKVGRSLATFTTP